MEKLVSVVMSTYNESEKEIKQAIDSILNQTYTHFEFVIILDNPENAEILKLLTEYEKVDQRINLIFNEENIGLAMSLNKGIQLSKGEIIARMDADDISDKDRIKRQMDYLFRNDLDMVSSSCMYINEADEVIGSNQNVFTQPHQVNKILPLINIIVHPSVIIKKAVIDDVGGYRNFKVAQDYDLWLRLVTAHYKIGIINEPLISYRIRKESNSRKDKYKQFLIDKYQKQLYKQRLEKGTDDFSVENLEEFMKAHGYYDGKNRNTFNLAYETFQNAMELLRKGNVMIGIKQLFKANTKHKYILELTKRFILFNMMKKFFRFNR
ncbi:glycosyltransferase [Bacillus sp. FJAT-47783]|uniref:glycosyltransferase n=1 Tax=Bacillus sp. FJAT-47783 TaxID=2922712 RepID=UPI001FACD282|nr:glycosyltransferase [Bacillus sp. FJAT-47783]